jgi:cardiolipin synthase
MAAKAAAAKKRPRKPKRPRPRDAKGRLLIEVPLWMAIVTLLFIAVLFLWAWSKGRQVTPHVRVRGVDDFAEGLASIAGMTQADVLSGNSVQVLENGDGFFPPALADIQTAQKTIHLETYVWWKGRITERVAALLSQKARQGVEVRLIVDSFGSTKMEAHQFQEMVKAGVKATRYHPFKLSEFGYVNNRTHRKLLIVDDRVAYVFGHGIAAEWTGNGQDAHHWRDTGVRLLGPIVNSAQSAFAQHWGEAVGEALVGPRYFRRQPNAGTIRAHMVVSAPRGGISHLDVLIKMAIATAKHELIIQNPYFIPDDDTVELLHAAVKRGVDVRIMVPGPVTDSGIVKHAGHFYFEDLTQRGIKLYVFQRTMSHQKIVLVDGLWSLVGSSNLDDRSYNINDEVSVGIIDAGIAAQLKGAFEDDLKSSLLVKLDSWNARGFFHKAEDWLSYRVNGQL